MARPKLPRITPPSKICVGCSEDKVAAEFLVDTRSQTNLSSKCRDCLRAYYNSRKEKNNAYRRGYRKRNPEKWRRRQVQYHYGITYEEYLGLTEKQQNKCGICGETKPLQVDHNHKTGEVRGLLCGVCNRALGVIEKYGNDLTKFFCYLGDNCNGVEGHKRCSEATPGQVADY